MPNSYELVVMLDADAPTDTRTKIVKDAEALLGQHGEVKATKAWGVRQLPYEIDHHEQADYSIFRFETEPASIATLDRALKLTEGVLRFRIFEAETEGEIPENPPLFKREERAYERPPREAQADGELQGDSEPPAEAPAEAAVEEAPAADGEASEASAADAPAAEEVPAAEEAPAAEADAPAE
jgi:ribosomal protein S6